MKKRMLKKDILATNQTVLCVPDCGLQNLLKLRYPYAYTCGTYGWNADVYSIGTTAICTGYRPFGKKVPHELCKKYDDEALEYFRTFSLVDPDVSKAYIDNLLYKFIEEAKAL